MDLWGEDMSAYSSASVYPVDPETFSIEARQARNIGASYSEKYQNEQPYPHICIDNFLPLEVLERCLKDLEGVADPETQFSRPQENLKSSYIPERLPIYTKNFFYALNSRPFIAFLEAMTGIKGLIPDPYFAGAGIHRVSNGGHLDIHADFNHHAQLNLERRLNVLIYLNHDWQEDWGGSFEIWDKAMSAKQKSFAPVFNRMVTFSTGSDTFHGNPQPVQHPQGKARQSIALYYYTATWDPSRKSHTTLFKPRPGTHDESDNRVRREALLADLMPPVVFRRVIGPLRRLGF